MSVAMMLAGGGLLLWQTFTYRPWQAAFLLGAILLCAGMLRFSDRRERR